MAITSIQPLASSLDAGTAAPTAAKPNDAVSKDAFLKLLVAQIRNQNPLNPADGVEFLTQLTQFTQLEQSMAMRQELEQIRQAVTRPADSAGDQGQQDGQ